MLELRYLVGFLITTALVLVAVWWGFARYYETLYHWLNMQASYQIFFGEIGLQVTVADEPAKWQRGLSGVRSLGELEGELFIFDSAGVYGIWMKDMQFPIDVIWIDNNFKVVHIEKNISPGTYPQVFANTTPARFVLEVNANFANSFAITEGSLLTLPASLVPKDLQSI